MPHRFTTFLAAHSVAALSLGVVTPAGAEDVTSQLVRVALHSHALSGSWGNAIEIPGTSGLNAGGSDELDAISCSSRGNCSAGGIYTNAAAKQQVFVVSEVNGTRGNAIEILRLAILNAGNSDFNDISCSSAGNCAAVGDYQDTGGHLQALWSTRRAARGSAQSKHRARRF